MVTGPVILTLISHEIIPDSIARNVSATQSHTHTSNANQAMFAAIDYFPD